MLRRFIVLDMDRTLLDTAAYSLVLMDAFGVTPGDKKKIMAVLNRHAGNNFDLYSYLMAHAPTDEGIIQRHMLAAATPALLMPGVQEFIARLDGTGDAYGILTTGAPQNQALKLVVVRALLGKSAQELPAEITHVANKSADFALKRWRPAKKAFYINEQLSGVRGGRFAEYVLLVDDKATNLTTLHAQITALHVPVVQSAGVHSLKSVGDYIRHSVI